MKISFTHLFLSLVTLLIFDSCARRGRPTGGEKDVTAPIMIVAEPSHKSIHFKSEKIRINFNEYIKLKDMNKQLVISPPLENQPIIIPVGTASKFIEIKLLDTLKENTTYTFNFGNSIEDNNEGNPLKQFKYVFSTGNYIDSLNVSGTITDGFNKNADKNISVMLYEVTNNFSDSIIYKERPNYVANTLDSIGFELTNIKKGKYLLVALNDANNNYKYDAKIDKIGYYPEFITLPTDTSYLITLFKEELPFKLIRASEVKKGHIYFGYQGKSEGVSIELLTKEPKTYKSKLVFEKEFDTISYWFTPQKDSLQFKVTYQKKIDTVTVKLRSKEIDSLLIRNNIGSVLSLKDTFSLTTNIPIDKVNKANIKIIDKDSTNVLFTTFLNPSKTALKLNFKKKYNNKYTLTLLPNAIEDLFGNVNDTLQFKTTTKHPDDYGIIGVTLHNIRSFPIIVDLLDEDFNLVKRVYSEKSSIFNFNFLEPKKYFVRVIYDSNKNKKWDTGNFLKKLKPEIIKYTNSPIEIKANWKQHLDFDLTK